MDEEDKKRRGPRKRCAGYWKDYDAKYKVFGKKKILTGWLGRLNICFPSL